jgi:hypothetical protein
VANLIDKTYFVGERMIPNTDQPAVLERLNWFITKYESELLRALLGYQLYEEMKAGLVADPILGKWISLRDGDEYTVDGVLYKWDGLQSATTFQSMIADYVYYWWMRDSATQTTGVGETIPGAENAVRVSPADKMCYAWNEMVAKAQALYHFLENHTVDYASWDNDYQSWLIVRPINPFNL